MDSINLFHGIKFPFKSPYQTFLEIYLSVQHLLTNQTLQEDNTHIAYLSISNRRFEDLLRNLKGKLIIPMSDTETVRALLILMHHADIYTHMHKLCTALLHFMTDLSDHDSSTRRSTIDLYLNETTTQQTRIRKQRKKFRNEIKAKIGNIAKDSIALHSFLETWIRMSLNPLQTQYDYAIAWINACYEGYQLDFEIQRQQSTLNDRQVNIIRALFHFKYEYEISSHAVLTLKRCSQEHCYGEVFQNGQIQITLQDSNFESDTSHRIVDGFKHSLANINLETWQNISSKARASLNRIRAAFSEEEHNLQPYLCDLVQQRITSIVVHVVSMYGVQYPL